MDNNDGIITLEDEMGRFIDMNVIEMIEFQETRYVLLQSTDSSDENSYIFRYREDVGFDRLESVDDDNELDDIKSIFEEKISGSGPVN